MTLWGMDTTEISTLKSKPQKDKYISRHWNSSLKLLLFVCVCAGYRWCTPTIPAFGRWRQKGQKLKACLSSMRSCLKNKHLKTNIKLYTCVCVLLNIWEDCKTRWKHGRDIKGGRWYRICDKTEAAEPGLTRKEMEAAGERAGVWARAARGRAHGNKV